MRAHVNSPFPVKVKSLFAAVFGLVTSLLLAVCVAAHVHAQEQDAQPAQQEQPTRQEQGGGNLMQQLNLTPEQRVQLREIRRQSEPEARELTRRTRLARRALDEAIYSDAVDEALIEQRARELAAAQTALVRLRAVIELKVRRVLTPVQLQSFRDLRQQAQRRQLMQRRLRNNMRRQPGALEPDTPNSNSPSDTQREQRLLNTPRARKRARLGRP
jgi:Spy/CpxP family protein refolding chaperone